MPTASKWLDLVIGLEGDVGGVDQAARSTGDMVAQIGAGLAVVFPDRVGALVGDV